MIKKEGHHDENLGFINLVMGTFSHFLSTSLICWSLDVHSMAPSIVQFCQSYKVIHLQKNWRKSKLVLTPKKNFLLVLIWRKKKCTLSRHLPLTMAVGKCLAKSFNVALIWFIINRNYKKGKLISFHIFLFLLYIWIEKLEWKNKKNKERTKGWTFLLMYALSGSATIGERVPS